MKSYIVCLLQLQTANFQFFPSNLKSANKVDQMTFTSSFTTNIQMVATSNLEKQKTKVVSNTPKRQKNSTTRKYGIPTLECWTVEEMLVNFNLKILKFSFVIIRCWTVIELLVDFYHINLWNISNCGISRPAYKPYHYMI